jgi:large repetitive protein
MRRVIAFAGILALLVSLGFVVSVAQANTPVIGAGFTTHDKTADSQVGPVAPCVDGNSGANCNTSATGDYVWLNVASAAAPLEISKDAHPTFTRTFEWGIAKTVDQTQINVPAGEWATFTYTFIVTHDGGTDSAWQVAGTINVSNPNASAVDAVVSDSIDDPNATCLVDGDPNHSVTLPGGGSVDLAYTCTYSTAPSSYDETNTATLAWNSPGARQVSYSRQFTFESPTIVNGSALVADTLGGYLFPVSYTDPSPKSFTYQHTFSFEPVGTCSAHTSTAKLLIDDSDLVLSSDPVTVKVCVGANLTVSETAVPAFRRDYTWDVSKAADRTRIELPSGWATAKYRVRAWQTGFVDGGWRVGGKIHVVNPNDWEAIRFDASDAVPGGACIVKGGKGLVLAASASVDLPYVCAFAARPPYNTDLTSTATITWDSAAYYTPDQSAASTETFQFAAPTTVDKTVVVTDTVTGRLGKLTATDTTPYASARYSYSHTLKVPKRGCVTYTNTVRIVGTGQTASQKVTVCGRCAPGPVHPPV